MVASTAQMNGKHEIVTGIKEVPVTQEREPAVYLEKTVRNPGIARANCCPTKDTPNGADPSARSTFWRSAVFMAPALSFDQTCLGPLVITALQYTQAGRSAADLSILLFPAGGDNPSNRTVLQQHCDFWDEDKDGIIYPMDTYRSADTALSA